MVMKRRNMMCVVVWLTAVSVTTCSATSSRNEDVTECRLSNEEIGKIYDEKTKEWKLSDAFVKTHELQEIVDCAKDNDTLLLTTFEKIEPSKSINITKKLTIRGQQRDEEQAMVSITCPPSEPLLLIKDVDVTLEKMTICDCNYTEESTGIHVVDVKCNRLREKQKDAVRVTLSSVRFINITNPVGTVGIYVHNRHCVTVKMRDVAFMGNTFLMGSSFGKKNDLKDIEIYQNRHYWERPADEAVDLTHSETNHAKDQTQKNKKDNDPSSLIKNWKLHHALFFFQADSATTMKNTKCHNNTGMMISVKNGKLSVDERSSFEGNRGQINASIIADGSDVTFTGVLFQSNVYESRSACLALYRGSMGSIHSSHFIHNEAAEGSCIYGENIKSLQINGSSFEENSVQMGGSISIRGMSGKQSKFALSDCSFAKNLAVSEPGGNFFSGTVFIQYANEATVSLSSTIFEENHNIDVNDTRKNRGTFILSRSEKVTFLAKNASFRSNHWAFGSGLHFSNTGGKFFVKKSHFSTNIAQVLGSAIYLEGSDSDSSKTNLSVTDCHFFNNSGNKGTVFIQGGRKTTISISNSSFEINTAKLGGSVVLVKDVNNFDMTDCRALNNNVTDVDVAHDNPGAVHLVLARSTVISRSTFSYNSALVTKASAGGAMYYDCDQDSCFLDINNCTFERNVAPDGGALFINALRHLNVTDSVFFKNRAHTFGGAIFFQDFTPGTIDFADTDFTDNTAVVGGAMSVKLSETFNILRCRFVRNRADLYGGAIACPAMLPDEEMPAHDQKFSDTLFEKNSAKFGGAVFVDASTTETNVNAFLHPNAIASADASSFNTLEGVVFSENHAEIAGGAIFVKDLQYAGKWKTNCRDSSKSDSDQNSFEVVELTTVKCEKMEGNTVSEGGYGEDIATPAVGFFAKLNSVVNDKEPCSLANGSTHDLPNWKSGDSLPLLQVTAYDVYGQGPARTRSSTMDVLSVKGSVVPISKYDAIVIALLRSPGEPLLENDLVTELTEGEGNITIGAPLVKPGNYSAVLSVGSISKESITLNINARDCRINEYKGRGDKQCLECDVGHYNFDPQGKNCSVCPATADCSREYLLPHSGHWNAFPCSSHIQSCVYKEACRGGKKVDFTDIMGDKKADCELTEDELEKYGEALCEKGYRGHLCGSCISGYGKVGMFRCRDCGYKAIVVLALFGAFVILLFLTILQIRGNLSLVDMSLTMNQLMAVMRVAARLKRLVSRRRRLSGDLSIPQESSGSGLARETTGVIETNPDQGGTPQEKARDAKIKSVQILKIAINFVQAVAAGMSLSVAWSESIFRLLEAWDWIGGAVSQASTFSFTCVLPSDSKIPRSIVQTVLSITMPLTVTILLCLFWVVRKSKKKRDWKYLTRRCILTVVAVLYVSYLPLIRTSINVFYCATIFDSTTLEGIDAHHSYWVVDTSVRCFDDSHKALAIAACLLLVLLGIAFPMALAIVLLIANSRDALQCDWIRETIWVLFVGFKEKYMFWECIVLLRKALVALIVVFAYNLGGNLQAALLEAVLLCSLFTHIMVMPYDPKHDILNHLESISLFISSCTVLSGLILNDDNMSWAGLKISFTIFVLVANVGFTLALVSCLINYKFDEMRYTVIATGSEEENVLRVIAIFSKLKFDKLMEKLRTKFPKLFAKKTRRTEESQAEGESIVEDPIDEGPTVEDPIDEGPTVEDPIDEGPTVEDPIDEGPSQPLLSSSEIQEDV